MGKLSINIISKSTTQNNANDSEMMSLIEKKMSIENFSIS